MYHELHEGKMHNERIVYFCDPKTYIMVRGASNNQIFITVPSTWELSACVSS